VFNFCHDLRVVDLSDCDGLYSTALYLLFDKNKNLELLQLSGCSNAVDNRSVKMIAGQENLEFFDISYCRKVTDEGLMAFKDKNLELNGIVMNALPGVTSAGVAAVIGCCTDTLLDFEASNLDQDTFKGDALVPLGRCWNIETIDISGCKHIDD
jgi:hypothetical protein